MKKLIVYCFFILSPYMLFAQADAIYPIYEGGDLGLTYTPKSSFFRIWAPTAQAVTLRLYKKGTPTLDNRDMIEAIPMQKSVNGTWIHRAEGDRIDQFYTFQIRNAEGNPNKEVPDPYAKAVGTNGLRAQVVDLTETDPYGFREQDPIPPMVHATDAVIYEAHIRDLSIHLNSGMRNKGKFAALNDTGTVYLGKTRTGLDHLREMGITHLHLLPSFDYYSVDESIKNNRKYNWGYDPLNYNVPEGSYSTNAADPTVRIKEFKEMIYTLHRAGIRVVMDVVYNHTMFGEESNFEQLVPGYFHRRKEDSTYANGSGCGNEMASERGMYEKFMAESLAYWVKEYHIDGFRFDLMGLHDTRTMNRISLLLHTIKPSILLYGEGWTAGDTPLKESLRTTKANVGQVYHIAAFSDDMRDGLKGSVFNHKEQGFVSGNVGLKESVKFGIVAATKHPQLDYSKVNYSKAPWAFQPYQAINYVECHDNHTLWDRLAISNPDDTEEDRIKMHLLAQMIVLTSQGIPFLHAGQEFLRTKLGVENSYNSPDSINAINWSRKKEYINVTRHIEHLITLRKNHPAFRMPTSEMIVKNLQFLGTEDGLIAYTLNNNANGDSWKTILVAFNANRASVRVNIPESKSGKWRGVLNSWESPVNEQSARAIKDKSRVVIEPLSALILVED
jgi:pullulanase